MRIAEHTGPLMITTQLGALSARLRLSQTSQTQPLQCTNYIMIPGFRRTAR